MAKLKGVSVSVFTLGGASLVGVLTDSTVSIDIAEEDGSGVNEFWGESEATGGDWQITGTALVEDVASLMTLAIAANTVTISYNTGGNTYAGTGLITQAGHQIKRKALQTQSFTIKGKGILVATGPGGP